jgi:hypothetical protein
MLFDHALVYNYEKFGLMAVLLAAIILTAVTAAHTFCANLPRMRRGSLLALHGVVLILQTSQFLAVAAPPKELAFHVSAQCIALLMLGPAFYIYVYILTCRKFMSPPHLVALFLIPAAGILLVLTNHLHQLFFTFYHVFYVRFSPAFFYVSAYNYLCAAAALRLMFRQARQARQNGGAGVRLIAAAAAALLMLLTVDLFEWVNPLFFPYDLTPAALAPAQIVFLLAGSFISRYHSLLTARVNVLDSLNESIIMTDWNKNVEYFNHTPLNELFRLQEGISIDDLSKKQSLTTAFDFRDTVSAGEFTYGKLNHGGAFENIQTFSYLAQPLYKGKKQNNPVGVLYSFRDISAYKTLIASLDAKNYELTLALEKLKKHMLVITRLAKETEREKILRQMRETVGSNISKIVDNLVAVILIAEKEGARPAVIKEKIEESIQYARTGIHTIRESVSTLYLTSTFEGRAADDPGADC